MGFFEVYESAIKGVMILINNNVDQEVTKVVKDLPNGNFIILEIYV